MWRLWARSLGTKEGKNEKEADIVALVRTTILFSYMLTNAFIVAGVVKHWHDGSTNQSTCIQRNQAPPHNASPTNQQQSSPRGEP
jgi:hypothetical protein